MTWKIFAAMALVVLFSSGTLQAQQRMQYTQYNLNGFLTNPALAGSEDFMDLKAGYSHQWTGFSGGPKGLYLTFHTPVGLKDAPAINNDRDFKTLPLRGRNAGLFLTPSESNAEKGTSRPLRHGLGGYAYSESMGPITINGLNASYGIHFPLGQKLTWSLGASVGLLQFRLDPTDVVLNDPNDVAVSGSSQNQILPNLNVGTMVYHKNFFLGASVKQLLRNKVTMSSAGSSPDARLDMHYFVTAGLRVFLSEKTELIPSVMFRMVNPAPPSLDINLSLWHNDLIFGSLTYRPGDAAAAQIGFVIKNRLLLSYAYDYTLSGLSAVSSGTHGIVLGARLGLKGKERNRAFFLVIMKRIQPNIPFILLAFFSLAGSFPLQAQSFQGKVLSNEVNSSAEELGPIFSSNGKTMYFVRDGHSKNVGGKSAGQDIWVTTQNEGGTWSKAELLPDPLNNIEHNAIGGVASNGTSLILANLYPSDGGYSPGISIVNGYGTDWGDPEKIKDASQTAFEGFLSIYCRPEMDIMLVSMTQGNAGFEDIYVSRKDESGMWSSLKDLGTRVNSAGYETSPFLTHDTRLLFFTSDFQGGEGNGDIFMSFRRDDSWSNWSTPINLGNAVNREGFDGYFTIAPGGKMAYFVSGAKPSDPGDIYQIPVANIPLLTPSQRDTLKEITRQGTPLVLNYGPSDKINFDKSFGYSTTGNGQYSMNPKRSEPFVYAPRPSFTGEDTLFSVICRGDECTSYATIVKVVPGTPPPLPLVMDTVFVSTPANQSVSVRLPKEDPTTKTYRSIEDQSFTKNGQLKISDSGEPFVFIPERDFAGNEIREITLCDAGGCRIYPVKIKVEEEAGFVFGDSDPVDEEPPAQGMVRFTGKVLDRETGDPIGGDITFIDPINGNINEISIEKGRPYRIELESGKNYKVWVSNNDYYVLNTSIGAPISSVSSELSRDFRLDKSPIKVNPNDIYELRNVYFDFDKATLQERSFHALDSIANYLAEDPRVHAEFRGHTDSRGNDDYNQRLSQSRAESVVKYMVEKGIREDRLSFRGFGEEKPVADNNTDQGRALNRRVELRIIRQ